MWSAQVLGLGVVDCGLGCAGDSVTLMDWPPRPAVLICNVMVLALWLVLTRSLEVSTLHAPSMVTVSEGLLWVGSDIMTSIWLPWTCVCTIAGASAVTPAHVAGSQKA